ncbi:MAG: glycosyltransferase, partial [Methylohalobius sp.]
KFLAPELARLGHRVVALTLKKTQATHWQGVTLVPYSVSRGSTPNIHPWLADFETKILRGEACLRACQALDAQGFRPDAILAHPGWGESLFLKDLWPKARLGIYCEFFYHAQGADVGFDPEFPAADPVLEAARLRLKNLNTLLHFEVADAGISPTYWQASTFPKPFRDKITVIHDGIDTAQLAPNPQVTLNLSTQRGERFTLTRADEVVTFVNRNLEPYRGFHVFMRALPELLRRRPKARVLIVGGNEVSYGARPDPKRYGGLSTWREIFTAEVRPKIPEAHWQRVHFLGLIPYPAFVALLQLSSVHVYLTYPFVLSWSLLEAMSVGCAIAASDTPPVREAIHHGETGRLVGFFDPVRGKPSHAGRLNAAPWRRRNLRPLRPGRMSSAVRRGSSRARGCWGAGLLPRQSSGRSPGIWAWRRQNRASQKISLRGGGRRGSQNGYPNS